MERWVRSCLVGMGKVSGVVQGLPKMGVYGELSK